MKIGTRLLFSLYIGFVAASLVCFLYSPSGLLAHRQLLSDVARLETNLQELKVLHQELTGEFESLRRSSRTVILRARDLGFAQSNETFLMLEELTRKPQNYYSVGRIIVPRSGRQPRSTASLLAGIVTMAAAFLLIALFSNPQRRAEGSAHN
ncbi:septum formation initiator family protein [Marispirochaeta sp.]|jgi:cell division protein FtsB|uniref:FtsB family cell division protein n=1 Tax=Marispirochaeta sp. TaxID=2038653 RepID=UPI0029C65A90|nr:septum formation initiator family protein [Marispirochaeta sp.]